MDTAPSPTAVATRLIERWRTAPAAKEPGFKLTLGTEIRIEGTKLVLLDAGSLTDTPTHLTLPGEPTTQPR